MKLSESHLDNFEELLMDLVQQAESQGNTLEAIDNKFKNMI